MNRYNNSRSTVHDDTARIANLRARAIAALAAEGMTYDQIASATGLSKPQIGRLIAKGRAASILRDGRTSPL